MSSLFSVIFVCGHFYPRSLVNVVSDMFISVAQDIVQYKPSQIVYLLLWFFNSLFFLLLAFPHLICLCLGTLPSALFSPCAPPSVCVYSHKFIYLSFRGSGLLLVINTRVKWSVTLPGLVRKQRSIGIAGTVPSRLP